MKLIALKRLHYPSGPSGKEYAEGDAFEALSERDAKALKLIRKAKDAPGPTQRRKIVDLPPEAMKPVTVEAKAVAPMSTESTEPLLNQRGYYQRRDMKAEE